MLNAPAQTGRPSTVPCLYFESGLGRFVVDRLEPRWPAFQPQADGQPILKGCTALAAECRGATLAVLFDGFRSGIGRKRLCIFSRTEGKLLTEFRMNNSEDGFTLSSDGRLLCRKTSTSRLAITPIPGVPGQSFLTACRGYAQPTAFWAAASACMIETTRHNTHLLRWHDRGLEVIRRGGDVDLPKSMEWLTVVVPSRDSHLPEIVRYDKKRFTFIVLGGVIMLVDRYGQIVFLDWQSKLLCMAFAYRDKLALWMPDGTCYGPASLTGRPATRGALEKIGHALWKAAQGGSR